MAVVGADNEIFLARVRDHIRKVVIALGLARRALSRTWRVPRASTHGVIRPESGFYQRSCRFFLLVFLGTVPLDAILWLSDILAVTARATARAFLDPRFSVESPRGTVLVGRC
jgi:hypothetical protein